MQSSLTSYPALCCAKRTLGGWWGLLLCFVWNYSTVTMWDHVYSERVSISAHSLTSCQSVYSICLSVEHFSSDGVTVSEGRVTRLCRSRRREEGERFRHFTTKLKSVPSYTNTEARRSVTSAPSGRTQWSLGWKIAMNSNDDQKACNPYALLICFALKYTSWDISSAQVHFQRGKKNCLIWILY